MEVKRGTSTGRGSRRADRGAGIGGGGGGWKSNGELPNRRRETSTGKQTGESLARFADRGARIGRGSIVGINRGSEILAPIGEDRGQIGQLLIGLANRGARSAERGTFQPADGRRGAADYTRKKDTKNPALGGVDRIGVNDQT